MRQICPVCKKVYGAGEFVCPDDLTSLEPHVELDDPEEPEIVEQSEDYEPWSPAQCWSCGTESPSTANTECLKAWCRKPLIPPALVLRFGENQIEVRPGERVPLGREGPHASAFRIYPNVSRDHAVVGVDADGSSWIEPRSTPNGTWVNGVEIPALVRQPLRHRDSLRFALDAAGSVKRYQIPL